MKVSLVIPTLNEEHGIGPTLGSVDRAAFASRGWDLDVVIVDGDSTDRTRELAAARGARVVVEPRRGYGRAYKTGFAAASGDILVTGDADGTYPFERVHDFVAVLVNEGLDFLTCDRYADLRPGAMTGLHRVGNWVLSVATRTLFGIRVRDSQSGMWVLRRTALATLDVATLPDGMAFSQEIKIRAFRGGLRAREIPAGLKPRLGEAVLSSWKDGVGNLRSLLRLRFSRRL